MQTPDQDKWKKAVQDEYYQMLNAQVFKVVQKASLPKGAKILSNT